MISQRAYLLMSCLIPLCVSCTSDISSDDSVIDNSVHSSADGSSNLTLQPPAAVLAARMVDTNQLELTVTVGGTDVPMSPSGDGAWSGNIDLTPGINHRVLVSWIENFNQQTLLLARADRTVQVTAGDTESKITFTNSEFNTTFDSDSDGRSNLSERINGSDPFDASSPEAPPTFVAVELQINIPNTFQSSTVNAENLTMIAFVNNQTLVLTRSDLNWTGGLSLIENSDAFIDAQLFRDSTQNLRIGVVRKTTNVGAGGLIVVPDTDFDFNFDDDGDGFSNLEEILNGYDPLDSDDPMIDPCLPTPFMAGCTTDSDDDGDSDFQETETADEDEDGIPDYLESSITDADEDLYSAQSDRDETDPCVPDAQSFACINAEATLRRGHPAPRGHPD